MGQNTTLKNFVDRNGFYRTGLFNGSNAQKHIVERRSSSNLYSNIVETTRVSLITLPRHLSDLQLQWGRWWSLAHACSRPSMHLGRTAPPSHTHKITHIHAPPSWCQREVNPIHSLAFTHSWVNPFCNALINKFTSLTSHGAQILPETSRASTHKPQFGSVTRVGGLS